MDRGGTTSTTFLRDVRHLFEAGTTAGVGDGPLLRRFVDRRDAAAFEALVARHGAMILGVCRHLLRDPNDAADAYQATLLVLVRKAASLRVEGSLAPWLYGVASRVAARSRSDSARRASHERTSASTASGATAGVEPDDSIPVLHDELARLPEPFRASVVLCHLEGLTHEQAAARLRCPVGTVRSRLARGRALLRTRLGRRGINGPACLAVLRPFSAPVPVSLHESTMKAAACAAAGRRAAEVIPASAAALTEGVLRSMLVTKIQAATAATVTASLLAAVVLAYQVQANPPDSPAAVQDGAGVGVPPGSASRSVVTTRPLATTFAKTYYVDDLVARPASVDGDPPGKVPNVDMQPIIDLLTSTVASNTWRVTDQNGQDVTGAFTTGAGGDTRPVGSITPFFLSDSLIIRHTAEVHEMLSNRLRQIRSLRLVPPSAPRSDVPASLPKTSPPPDAVRRVHPVDASGRADRIRRKTDELNREVEGLLRENGRATPNG